MKKTIVMAVAVTVLLCSGIASAAEQDAESCCRLGNGIVCCWNEITDWLWDNGMPW